MRVVVSGLGMISPLGTSVAASWKNLLQGKSGLVSTTTLPDYKQGWSEIPAKVVGKVPGWNSEDHLERSELRRMALFAQYAVAATKEALTDAKIDLDSVDKSKVGVALGSGIGSFEDVYNNLVAFNSGGYRKVQPLFIPKLLTNMAAGNISIKYGFEGPLHSVSTACATGLHAIGDAYNFIRNGYADIMVCGGTESSLHPLALAGFARARSLATAFNDDPEAASRPFDALRSGFVLSEGCGVLVVESLDSALGRSAPILAEITGYGLSGDANHITAPREDGEGAFKAMQMAIDRSGVSRDAVDYINAHATSTVIGDRAENNAIGRLFNKSDLAVSLTKGSMGHLLGAAGAVELIFTVKAIQEQIAPPTRNLTDVGGHEGDDKSKFKFDYVGHEGKKMEIRNALCNSFGFGGVNLSICFSKYEREE